MPSLPTRKVGIVACSGEELPEGTVTRLAALRVLEDLRPAETVTICLPLFLAGGEGDRAFARFYPTIAVDGCEKRCAARATELYSNKPAASIRVDDLVAQHGFPKPQGLRRLSDDARPLVNTVAEAIAAEVDRLMAVRWNRGLGVAQEPDPAQQQAVSSSACACGSGIPITYVVVDGHTLQLLALEPVFEKAHSQGLRADATGKPGAAPAQIWDMVQLYNPIPSGQESRYAQAVALAWLDYCSHKEQANG